MGYGISRVREAVRGPRRNDGPYDLPKKWLSPLTLQGSHPFTTCAKRSERVDAKPTV